MVGNEARPGRTRSRASVGLALLLTVLTGCGVRTASATESRPGALPTPSGTEVPYVHPPYVPAPANSVGVFSSPSVEPSPPLVLPSPSPIQSEGTQPASPSPDQDSSVAACPAGQTYIGSLLLTPSMIGRFDTQESTPPDTSNLTAHGARQPHTIYIFRNRPVHTADGGFADGGPHPTIEDMGGVGIGLNLAWSQQWPTAYAPFMGLYNPGVPAGDLLVQTCG